MHYTRQHKCVSYTISYGKNRGTKRTEIEIMKITKMKNKTKTQSKSKHRTRECIDAVMDFRVYASTLKNPKRNKLHISRPFLFV